MVKILLCFIIVALCGYIGIAKAKRIKNRLYCLKEMQEILSCLEADMKNEMLTLYEALKKEAENARAFGGMLTRCARQLKAEPGRQFHDIWDEAYLAETAENVYCSCLNRDDAALVKKTGRSLVNASIHTQDAYFRMLEKDYDHAVTKMKTEEEKKCRLYSSMGFMAGFLIAILLI